MIPTYAASQSELKKPLAEYRELAEEPEVIGHESQHVIEQGTAVFDLPRPPETNSEPARRRRDLAVKRDIGAPPAAPLLAALEQAALPAPVDEPPPLSAESPPGARDGVEAPLAERSQTACRGARQRTSSEEANQRASVPARRRITDAAGQSPRNFLVQRSLWMRPTPESS